MSILLTRIRSGVQILCQIIWHIQIIVGIPDVEKCQFSTFGHAIVGSSGGVDGVSKDDAGYVRAVTIPYIAHAIGRKEGEVGVGG